MVCSEECWDEMKSTLKEEKSLGDKIFEGFSSMWN